MADKKLMAQKEIAKKSIAPDEFANLRCQYGISSLLNRGLSPILTELMTSLELRKKRSISFASWEKK